jgi:serine protease
MKHRCNTSQIGVALVTLVVAAACSDVNRTPTEPRMSPSVESFARNPDGMEVLRDVRIHATVGAAQRARPTRGSDLSYHGGVGGIGVETAPKVYVVFYGSQWSNDPSGEATIVQNFLKAAGGSSWLNSVTQYCQNVSSGTIYCNGAGTAAGNPSGILAGVWFDNGVTAPSQPSQSQLAAEAVQAAAHFGNTSASSNATTQYVIATAHGNNSSGFGTQYCAYHSSTSSSYGNVAYTNLPYITDAGSACGANYNGLGPNAGITIVEGHEMAETITDQFPNGGWLDSRGAENGDKCAWIASGQGATASVSFGSASYPVQSLWSNAFNSGKGGCVLSY